MNTLISRVFCLSLLLLPFSRAGKLLAFSAPRGEVREGEWASFACTVKAGKASIVWKIGNFTAEEGNDFKYLSSHGVVARRCDGHRLKKNITECIEILATAKLDGAPVQCVAIPRGHGAIPRGSGAMKEYSKFAILTVSASNDSESSGQSSQDPRPRTTRSLTPSSSGAPSFTTSTTTTVLLAIILAIL